MISPSDNAVQELPVGMASELLGNSFHTGPVFPLEFKAVGPNRRYKQGPAMDGLPETDAMTTRLQEELAALGQSLHTQRQQLLEQMEQARHQAKLEASQEWESHFEERLTQERQSVAEVCAEFAKKRTDYFAAVESEVVRLSLAIASRVLHREAKLDPLLLSAAVRVALEKITEESEVKLHVPMAEVERWKALFVEESYHYVHVVGEESMAPSDCVLETSMGRAELGVSTQLEEIERGFFDLLQQRPM